MSHYKGQDATSTHISERLQDAHDLIVAANQTFQMSFFPSDPSSCFELIDMPGNLLSDYDIEGLKSLSSVVEWALDLCPPDF